MSPNEKSQEPETKIYPPEEILVALDKLPKIENQDLPPVPTQK